MRTGDQVTLTNGQTVKINSIDMTRKVFDYLNGEETTEASFDDLEDLRDLFWDRDESGEFLPNH